MPMNKVPTLILGIGGIGCRIAANINDLLRPEDRAHIAIVGMDTNVNDLKALANRGIRTIQTSDSRMVLDYLKMHPEYMSWFPVSQFTVSRGMLNGAGQIRSISRLAALAAEENGMFVPIKEEIQRIRANRGESGGGNLTVMLVGSLTGGTGAGLFLQMPYYVRKVMRGESGLSNIIIRGMFVGPDLTADVQPSKINRDAVRVNGYACLKELNALYMRQTRTEDDGKLKIDFYTPANTDRRAVAEDIFRATENSDYFDSDAYDAEAISLDSDVLAKGNPEIPYDYLYLIEGSNVKGGIGNAPLSSVESLAARMVHTLMFTPVSDNALSVEDNMVLQDMEKGGMNRYSSAGLSRLIYPQTQAREYVTLCTIRDLVRDEWLIIDNAYNDEVSEARSRQRTDGQVKIPKIKDSFVELYKKQVKGDGRLGRLYNEAFTITENKVEMTRGENFMTALTDLIRGVEELDDVVSAKQACEMDESNMHSFAEASSEISAIYDALDEYAKLAKRLVTERGASIANELFPPSWQSMRHKMDAQNGLYPLLANVHPLTARFLCYDLILKLEKRIGELEGAFAGINLDEYLEEDFDIKESGTQTAGDALQRMQEKQIPVLSALSSEASKIKKIKIKFRDTAATQCDNITQYLKQGLELAACQILLKRFEQLAENYRVFFQSIGTMILENNDRIGKLEELTMPLGQIGVYCSRDAFRIIAAEYRSNVDNDLPEATKTAIFLELFKVLSTEFENENKEETERQKAARAAKKTAALGNIFRTAVVDTVRTDVVKKGAGIVDMNIRQALERQFELERPESDDLTGYLREIAEKGMRIAAPMLATSTNAMAENTETVYMALHPDCAATEMGEPNTGATKRLFLPQACEATDGMQATVLMDEAFSPCEITCFKARYKFSIEDLTKYAPQSENARAYNARIANLGKAPANSSDPEAFKTVVSPHLDRYWHEEAYLPAIYASERRKNELDTLKAFIYAMGLDCFKRMVDENTLDENGEGRLAWFLDTGRNLVPVKARGSHIGNSYSDLFQALPYNSRIKHFILSSAQSTMRAKKGYSAAEELYEGILDDWFVEDLIQSREDRGGEADENILDILLQMRDNMESGEWKRLFAGLQEVLWEFCAYLFDSNERKVNDAVRSIVDRMIANSRVGGKSPADLTYGERELMSQMSAIRSAMYKRI